MLFSEVINKDMIWYLGDRHYIDSSVDFLTRFKESLCLFSESVKQLYSNYDLFTTPEMNSKVVAMPNPYAYHDIYNDIPKSAIKPTGMYVIPNEVKESYHPGDLCLVYRSKAEGKIKTVSLRRGLEHLKEKYKDEGRFLPIIINKDLSIRKDHRPVMHLHRLDIEELKDLSDFQKRDISIAIEDKLNAIMM